MGGKKCSEIYLQPLSFLEKWQVWGTRTNLVNPEESIEDVQALTSPGEVNSLTTTYTFKQVLYE
jgi:hypothetical protein